MGICVSIWSPNQVEWPHSIRSELHVENLKRPKHAVHDDWLGTLLMTRIKTYNIPHPQLLCSLDLVNILLLYRYRIPLCRRHAVYMVICHTNSVGMCHGGRPLHRPTQWPRLPLHKWQGDVHY